MKIINCRWCVAMVLSQVLVLGFALRSELVAEELSRSILDRLRSVTTFVKIDDEARTLRGSGFFITEHVVVTNVHVLGISQENPDPPQKIQLVLMSGQPSEKTIEATILSLDYPNDLAFLKVPQQQDIKPLTIRKSESISETAPVYILGFPLAEGLDLQSKNPSITVTTGSISSLRRNTRGIIEELQVNGNINPGNSGGPIVDSNGELVAVSRAAILGLGVGFSIPSDTVASDMEGQISSTSLNHNALPDELHSVDVSVTAVDPMNKIKRMAAYYWHSPIEGNRPLDPNEKFPTHGAPSDSPKRYIELKFDPKLGQWVGKLPSFRMPNDRDIWIQPSLATENGLRLIGAINHTKVLRAEISDPKAGPKSSSQTNSVAKEPKLGSVITKIIAPRFTPASKSQKVQLISPMIGDVLEAEKLVDSNGNPYALVKTVAEKVKIGSSRVKQLLADPHGDKVYAILENEPDVLVFDSLDPKVVRKISVPNRPVHLWCDSNRLVVACSEARAVVTVDTSTFEVTQSIKIQDQASLEPELLVGTTPDGSVVSIWKDSGNTSSNSKSLYLLTPMGTTQLVVADQEIGWCALLSRNLLWMQRKFPGHSPYIFNLEKQEREFSEQYLGLKNISMNRPCGHSFISKDNRQFIIPTEAHRLVDVGVPGYKGVSLVLKSDLSELLFMMEGTVLTEYPTEDCFVAWNDGRNSSDNSPHQILYLSRSTGRVFRRILVSNFDPHPGIFIYHKQNPSAVFLPGLEHLWVVNNLLDEGQIQIIRCGPLRSTDYVQPDPVFAVSNKPPKRAMVGKAMAFTPEFAQGNAKVVKFELEKGVKGMKINETTGKISFQPTDANLGIHRIIIVADVDGIRVPVVSWDLEIR